ncbi:hypothetical protein SRHO_G00114650 [Serrasalmus rhombeus]
MVHLKWCLDTFGDIALADTQLAPNPLCLTAWLGRYHFVGGEGVTVKLLSEVRRNYGHPSAYCGETCRHFCVGLRGSVPEFTG